MAESPQAGACKVILASTIAQQYLSELSTAVKSLNPAPKLVGFLANADPAAKMYADWTGKTCLETGFRFELREVNKDDLEEEILKANEDADVGGIMVYWPVFGSKQDAYLQQCVAKEKDVEGLSHVYVQNMYHNTRYLDKEKKQKSILPCTPLAVVKILEFLQVYNQILAYGNRLYGKTITIVNRSEIVGRPLAALLANDGAHVYSVDINGIQLFTRGPSIKHIRHSVEETTLTLADVAPKSDVIITGVPSPNYQFPTELIREGAVCINFSSEKNFNKDTVKDRAGIYVPMTGKVTVAMLLRNLIRLDEGRRRMLGEVVDSVPLK